MKYYKKKLCLILFSLIFISQVKAQGKADTSKTIQLTLTQVWEQAELNSKAIQLQKLRIQSSEEGIRDAKTDRLPEITAKAEYARVSNMPLYENGLFHTPEQFPVLHTYYKAGGDAYLNIFSGNQTNLRLKETKTVNQIALQQKNLTTSEVKLRAAAYFLDLQRSYIFKDLMIRNIAEQEKQLTQIRQLQMNGVVLKSDVLRAELQLSRQRMSLIQINNDITIASQKLNILIGQPDGDVIEPGNKLNPDSLVLKPYEDYLAEAMQHSFQYKISEKETDLRKLRLKEVKANTSPKIGVFANYAYTYPEIQFYPYAESLYGLGMAGIRLTLPVSALYKNKHKEKVAELEYKIQETAHSDTGDQIRQQVKEAWLRYQEALKRIDVAKTNIRQATENLRIVNNTYFNQLSLVTDLLDADTQLLQTRFDLASAQIAAQLQYYQLQQVIGNL